MVGLYDGTDPATAPECDGEPLEAYNAFYCPDGDYVAWDAGLLVSGADQIGDSWVYLVIAHEWGHAIQARLDSTLVAQAEEPGPAWGPRCSTGAVADGTLQFDPGDEQELVSSLSALADQMPWTMTSDHGDAFQRVQWFTLGRNGGVNACHDVLADPSASTVPTSLPTSVQTSVPTWCRPPLGRRRRPRGRRRPSDRPGYPGRHSTDVPGAGDAPWHSRTDRWRCAGQPVRVPGRLRSGAVPV